MLYYLAGGSFLARAALKDGSDLRPFEMLPTCSDFPPTARHPISPHQFVPRPELVPPIPVLGRTSDVGASGLEEDEFLARLLEERTQPGLGLLATVQTIGVQIPKPLQR